MWAKIVALWNNIPANTQKWIKGAEVAVATAIITAFVAAPASDFTTKKGIAEFAAGVATAVYGALRLYLTQSPVAMLVKKTTVSETRQVGEVSHTKETVQTVTQGGTAWPTVTVVGPNDPHKTTGDVVVDSVIPTK